MDIASEFEVAVVEIDAAQAAQLLARNRRNRVLSDVTVQMYLQDMKSGRWTMTGEPIQFDTDGNLVNGQHRLTAHSLMEDPDFTLQYVVVTGLEPESQMAMDQGRKRTTGAQLGMLGYKNSNFLAAAVRLLIVEEAGALFTDHKRWPCSTAMIVDWIEENSELIEETTPHAKSAMKSGGASAALAFFLKAWQVDPSGAKEFFHLLNTLEGLPKDSPILALEFRLRRIREIREKTYPRNTMGYFITAWNAWKQGQTMKKMLTPKGGWTQANWPDLKY